VSAHNIFLVSSGYAQGPIALTKKVLSRKSL
jgi:hypothetical protein